MKVQDLGESGLIRRLTDIIASRRQKGTVAPGQRLLVGLGDDAAAWRIDGATELATTDTVVEGVHFTRDTTPWEDLGWKVMAANVSDIAAMGGQPLYALVTLGLPPDTPVKATDLLYQGMLDLAEEFDFAIVGGDVVRSPTVFVTVALTGAMEGAPMLRSEAKPGDRVAVCGAVGSSAGGLRLLQEGMPANPKDGARLKETHRRPNPRLEDGRILAREGVKAAIDVSDGLADDLSKLCQASGLAAQVRGAEVPVDPALKRVFPDDYLNLALAGGEDYALIFTAPGDVIERVLPQLTSPTTVVGDILAGEPGLVNVVDSHGRDLTPSRGGWDHFR